MTQLHSLLVTNHIVFGAIALACFWIPVLARKGSRLHRQAGQVYVWAMYVVVASATIASLMVLLDPVGIRQPGAELAADAAQRLAFRARSNSLFLLMLAALVFASVRHGMLAVTARRRGTALGGPLHRLSLLALGALGVVVGVLGARAGNPLLMIFAALSALFAVSALRETLIEKPDAKRLLKAHFGGLIGGGIGAHTAFFAFGGARFMGDIMTGYWQLVPWLAPAVIGIAAIRWLERRQDESRQAG